MPIDPSKLVAWWLIGGSSADKARRMVGWGIHETGWQAFVDRALRPQVDRGIRRIMLHNPAGQQGDWPMDFDQFPEAQYSRLKPIMAAELIRAIRPLTREGVEVIAYLGSIDGDPDFAALLPDDPHGWLWRAVDSLRAVLDAGCSVAFDRGGVIAEDSPHWRLITLIESLGVRVYVEPRPHADKPHTHRMPVVALDTFWRRSNPATHPDAAIYARDEQLTGEVVRIVPMRAEPGQVERILADGHTPALSTYAMEGL